MTESTLGQRIAQRRKMLSLSQEAFGEKMGVSRQAASKWESDAAVPEIDKLINMSKLFEVSVGWLLGVEETEQPSDDQPEDPQLLFQFQPPEAEPEPQPPAEPEKPAEPAYDPIPDQPQPPRRSWLTTACAIVAVISIILNMISMLLYDRLAKKVSEPATQDSAISEQQSQLADLKTEVDDYLDTLELLKSEYDGLWRYHMTYSSLSKDVRELMEMYGEGTKLPTPDSILPVYENLSKWSLTAQKTTDFTQIHLNFNATSTVNLRSARIEARKNGNTVVADDCSVAGKHLLGELVLAPDTGLEYRLVLTHSDKTTQTITLEGHGLSDLVVLSNPIIRTTARELHLFPEKLYFTQGWLNIYIAVPHLAAENVHYEWSDLRINYYQNGVLMSDHDISKLAETYLDPTRLFPYLSFQVPGQTFQMQYFEEHDMHSLYLKGTLTVDGVPMEFSVPLQEWVVRDGQFYTVANP